MKLNTILKIAFSFALVLMLSPMTAAGYHKTDVLVEGTSIGAVTTNPFANLAANQTIAAPFAANPSYTITASVGPNGTISPAGVTTLNPGGRQTYTITPAAGYTVRRVLVDGAYVGGMTSYTFTDIRGNHTIEVSFMPM
jgi:hypothetical protein